MTDMNSHAYRTARAVCLGGTLGLLLAVAATAQTEPPAATLIAHWPLDGTGADATGNHNGVLISREGNAVPKAAAGKFGQALQFGGPAAVEVPLDIDPVNQQFVTITLWVKWLASNPATGALDIISSGSGHAPRIALQKGVVRVGAGDRTVVAKRALAPDAWHFLAVSWEHPNGAVTLYQDNSQARYEIDYRTRSPQQRYLSPRDPDAKLGNVARKRYLWIGAQDGINLRNGADGVLIDDVRLYAGVLSPEQLSEVSGGMTDGQLAEGVSFGGLDFLTGAGGPAGALSLPAVQKTPLPIEDSAPAPPR